MHADWLGHVSINKAYMHRIRDHMHIACISHATYIQMYSCIHNVHTQCMLKVTFFLSKYPNNYLSFPYFCPIAKTKFSAPMRKNSTIGIMVEVERHHKTSGVILILKEKVSQSPLLLLLSPSLSPLPHIQYCPVPVPQVL